MKTFDRVKITKCTKPECFTHEPTIVSHERRNLSDDGYIDD